AAARVAAPAGTLGQHRDPAAVTTHRQPLHDRRSSGPGAGLRLHRCAAVGGITPIQSVATELQVDVAVLRAIDVLVAHHVAAVGQAVDHRHAGTLHATGDRHVDVFGAPRAAAVAGHLVRQQLVVARGLVLLAGVPGHQAAIVQHAQVRLPHAVVVLVLGLAATLDDRAAVTPRVSAVVRGIELQILADHPASGIVAGGVRGQQYGTCRQRPTGAR